MNHEIVTGQAAERLVNPVFGCAQAPQPRQEAPGLVTMQGTADGDCCHGVLPFRALQRKLDSTGGGRPDRARRCCPRW
jgi:hypothetical protein